MTARFLQIHTLTSYPAALLNRDDAGFAKRLPFGGTTRTRISSQCLKRHWRMAEDEYALSAIGPALTLRSRITFDHEIVAPLIAAGLPAETVTAVAAVLMAAVCKKNDKKDEAKKAKKSDGKDSNAFHTGQVAVLGRPEVAYLHDLVRDIVAAHADPKAATAAAEERIKTLKDNLAALRIGSGLDAALFGRMVTSDVLARTNAAVHVAHAFTVHAEESESDYFTAVDDLLAGTEETGSGMIGNAELTSGLYYGYVVVDLPTLVSNLEGVASEHWESADHGLAGKVVEHLAHLIAKVSPGAKLGSTAPYGWAELVLLETGNRQPRSLANAFRKAVTAGTEGLFAQAVTRLGQQLRDLDAMYGVKERRWQASGGGAADLPAATRLSFDAAVDAAVKAVVG